MTSSEAKQLKVGDRVRFEAGMNDDGDGTVREVTYAAIKIEWDDAKWCIMPFQDDKAPFNVLRKLGGAL